MSETTPLPPYSGANAVCAKCDYLGAAVTYKATGVCHGASHDQEVNTWNEDMGRPRLCRRCLMCGYAWDEATIDPADQRETVGAAAE